MGMTITEKILARHSSTKEVHAGDLIECRMAVAVMLELFFSKLRQPKKVWDPNGVWLVVDHCVPAPTIDTANDMVQMRQFAQRTGIKNLIDVGRQGISHVVLSENGAILPGTTLANVDSHTASVGALNCAGRGLGNPDVLHVMCTGKTWFLVGPTVRFIVKGETPAGVYARDIIHFVAGKYGAMVHDEHGEVHGLVLLAAEVDVKGIPVIEICLDGRDDVTFLLWEVRKFSLAQEHVVEER